jgi:hypothetical protein
MTNDTLPGQDSGGIAPATSVTDAEIRDFAACIGLMSLSTERDVLSALSDHGI